MYTESRLRLPHNNEWHGTKHARMVGDPEWVGGGSTQSDPQQREMVSVFASETPFRWWLVVCIPTRHD